MDKGRKIALFVLIAVIAAAGAAAGARAYLVRSVQTATEFLQGTKLNGQNVSGKTPAEAAAMLSEGFDERQVVVMEEGKEVLRMPLMDLGYRVNQEKLEKKLTEYLESEKENVDSVLKVLTEGKSFTATVSYIVDKDVFAEKVTAEALSEPRRENENARVAYSDEEKKCVIEPEVQGTELRDEDLQDWLRGEINEVLTREQKEGTGEGSPRADSAENAETGEAAETEDAAAGQTDVEATGQTDTEAAGQTDAEAAGQTDAEAAGQTDAEATDGVEIVREIPASLYIPPEKTRENRHLQEKCSALNACAGSSITYVFGSETEKLTFPDFVDWLKVRDGEVTVREEKVAKYVRGLAEKYETRYLDRNFTTTYGNVVTFPAGLNEYGYTILEDQEAAQLTQDILSGEAVEREPVYLTLGPWGDPLYLKRNGVDDLAGTYVEVSISAQHLWYYIDGGLFIESDVVTGDTTLGQDTATGVFPLAFKESPSTLRGGEGKKKYVTKVQYWMPFYEGQGLHDAWWKSVFGGTEYIGNGSHGCVNLPPSVAETIYYNIEPGTAIIIYN